MLTPIFLNEENIVIVPANDTLLFFDVSNVDSPSLARSILLNRTDYVCISADGQMIMYVDPETYSSILVQNLSSLEPPIQLLESSSDEEKVERFDRIMGIFTS